MGLLFRACGFSLEQDEHALALACRLLTIGLPEKLSLIFLVFRHGSKNIVKQGTMDSPLSGSYAEKCISANREDGKAQRKRRYRFHKGLRRKLTTEEQKASGSRPQKKTSELPCLHHHPAHPMATFTVSDFQNIDRISRFASLSGHSHLAVTARDFMHTPFGYSDFAGPGFLLASISPLISFANLRIQPYFTLLAVPQRKFPNPFHSRYSSRKRSIKKANQILGS